MYTVIITEQEHIDCIREYSLFLEPFMNKTQFALCPWNPKESGSLKESVPNLDEIVAHREEWRAIIICEEKGLEKKNPFNVIDYQEPIWEGEEKESLEEYFTRRIQVKRAAYQEAAQEPLVKLVTRLCEDPTVTKRENSNTDGYMYTEETKLEFSYKMKSLTREELEYQEYRECVNYKKELREQIRGNESLMSAYPKEILCIAKRHHEDMDYELQCIWSEHDERNYTRFYDWNLYFDKMRYLIFDIDEKARLSYRYNYIRFLLSITLIAGNELPIGCLQPNRVYTLYCDTNVNVMTELLSLYDMKLSATIDAIQAEISEIRTRKIDSLTDDEVEKIFCTNINIPINLNGNHDRGELFCTEKFGLSKDFPVDDEEKVWSCSCRKNQKALRTLLKNPKRDIQKATRSFKNLSTLEEERAILLNEYQLDDLKSYIAQEEFKLADMQLQGGLDGKNFQNMLLKSQNRVQFKIDQRMKRKVIIFLELAVLGAVLLGMIPMFFLNHLETEMLIYIAVIIGIGLGSIVLASMLSLISFRMNLMNEVSEYNRSVGAIIRKIENIIKGYSVYLSNACNIMRGNSVLLYHETHKNGDVKEITILKKHCLDMEEHRAVMRDIFGMFMPQGERMSSYEELPYNYDFHRPIDYSYPLPKAFHLKKQIEFLEKGNYIEIPYGIVEKLELRREELYD